MSKKIIESDLAPSPIGPYSQAVEANGFLFISGQIALNPETGELDMGDLETETGRVMHNLHAILQAAGLDFEHVIKTGIFLSDMKHFQTVNAIYASYFKSHFPARETVQVAGLPRGVNVEISMIACKN